MVYFIFGGLLTFLFFLPLKYLKDLWEKEEAPGWSTYGAGVLSWLSLGSVGLMVCGFFQPIIGMFTAPQMSQGYELSFLVLGSLFLYYLNQTNPDFLDLPHMIPFIRGTLLFENIAGKRLNLAEETDKFEVRKVYKEVTGRELMEEQKPRRKVHRPPEEIQREVELLQNRRIVTPHLQDELNALNRNEVATVSDSWKINSLRTSAHTLYEQVKTVQIDPVQRRISLTIDFGEMDPAPLMKTTGVFRFYQEIYEFLQAMTTQNWMKPYVPYFDKITLIGFRTELDEFARSSSFMFLNLEIAVKDLRVREGKFFNPAELPTIASVRFQHGDPIF